MIVLFLSGMVAMIMMRTLHRDFNRYNATEAAEDVEEETGWKLVHGDVYAAARPPTPPRPTPSDPGPSHWVSCAVPSAAPSTLLSSPLLSRVCVSRAAASGHLRCRCCSL